MPGTVRTRLQAMNAGDIMVKDVVWVAPDTPVREVASLMLERRISGLPVVDGERRVLGIVSESDLIRRPEIGTYTTPTGWLTAFLSQDESARDFVKTHGLLASEVMSRPAICVAPPTPLAEVVRLFERHRVKRLPVVEHGRLAGLVTRAELLRALVARQAVPPAAPGDEEIRERIEAILRSEAWAPSTVVNVQVTGGVVQLWGAVSSNAQRDALVLAVRGTPGVKEVQQHLGHLGRD
jgi:CBS-domain-containing membrane protein